MSDITICEATQEECSLNCRRRNVRPNPYNQSYANFALDYLQGSKCQAYLGYGKKYQDIKLKIN